MLGEAIPAKLDVRAPKLIVTVDTEEAFDWTGLYHRSARDVGHIRCQTRAQAIYRRYRLKPTYLVDYPVASQEEGYRPIKEWLEEGLCEVGSHLHPWVNPPFDEALTVANTYAGNLPPALEREKLKRLTGMIATNFGCQPTVYRAGRYGIGPATAKILGELGYLIDMSVVPRTAFVDDGGPDFRHFKAAPFWFGPSNKILEIPLTVAWCGLLKGSFSVLQPLLGNDISVRLRFPGIFARTGLLERIRLTPEGITLQEMKRVTETLLKDGHRIFCMTYHSPSLEVGNTPYVRTERDLERFLHLIESFCEFFFGSCDGVGCTPLELRSLLLASQTKLLNAIPDP